MPKRLVFTTVILTVVYLLTPNTSTAQPYGYEGVQVCATCHKTEKQGQQQKIWQESAHAKAFKALLTPEAEKIAKDKGLTVKASEAKECLVCHTSGCETDKKLIGAKFNMEDGVQCETCHGAGSAYKSLKIMRSREESVKKGLVIWNDKAEMEAGCVKCHNPQSPTYKEFKFDEMWPKIAHPVPKG